MSTGSPERDSAVPDTLDLAEYGTAAINGVLGSCDPDREFENYFLTFFDVHPAYMIHFGSQVSGVLPKYVEALPLLRLMSGSDRHSDLEKGMLDSVLSNIADDGLIYDRASADRPWNTGVGYGVQGWDEDYANIAGNGRLVAGLLYYYQFTGEDIWRLQAGRTAQRILELAVTDGDFSYYPNVGLGNDFSYPRVSGWTHTKPPTGEFEGAEGTTTFYLLQPVRGLIRWYTESGDERFLELSRRIVNFGLQSRFWGGLGDIEPAAGAQRGHFWGHFHGRAAGLRGMLDYAIVADDYRVKEFVRDAYEWARHHGIHRLGVFPGSNGNTEGCTVADMVGLAVKLTDAGIGEYWEDLDHYVRNGLIACQATDIDELTRVSNAGRHRPAGSPWGGHDDMRFAGYAGVLAGQETTDRVLERSVGQFGHLHGARYLKPRLMHCCTGNGAQALYYGWEAITRRSGNTGEVNLWLNRRSPWLDLFSWLPHRGHLRLQNKGLERIAVRIPAWASPTHLRCAVNGQDTNPERIGNRLLLRGLTGTEVISIDVPVPTEYAQYTLANLNSRSYGFGQGGADNYDCEFRANTVLSTGAPRTSPSGQSQTWYRILRHEHMRDSTAPLKDLAPYVHGDKVVTW